MPPSFPLQPPYHTPNELQDTVYQPQLFKLYNSFILCFPSMCVVRVTGFVTTIIQLTRYTLNSIQRSIQHVYISHSCTRHITHMLHMHILHGKSLEAKQMHLSLLCIPLTL